MRVGAWDLLLLMFVWGKWTNQIAYSWWWLVLLVLAAGTSEEAFIKWWRKNK